MHQDFHSDYIEWILRVLLFFVLILEMKNFEYRFNRVTHCNFETVHFDRSMISHGITNWMLLALVGFDRKRILILTKWAFNIKSDQSDHSKIRFHPSKKSIDLLKLKKSWNKIIFFLESQYSVKIQQESVSSRLKYPFFLLFNSMFFSCWTNVSFYFFLFAEQRK